MTQLEVPSGSSTIRIEPPSLYEDLSDTKTKLQKLQEVEPRIVEYYERWREHRLVTIATLASLHQEIDALCTNCNRGRGVGAAVAVAGFVAGLIGQVLKAKGHASGEQFIQYSKYCSGAGTVVFASSSLLEAGLSRGKMDRIKEVIERDIELTEPLKRWVEFSHEVGYRFHRLLGCDIASPNFLKVIKVCGDCIKLLKAGSYEVKGLIRDLVSCKVKGMSNLTVDVRQKVLKFFRRIQENPNLTQPLREIFEIINETPKLHLFIDLGFRIFLQVNGIVPVILLEPRDANMLRCVFDTIKLLSRIVLQIFNLRSSISFTEIKKRQSKYSESLDYIKFALNSELEEVTKRMNECETTKRAILN